jgi:hypothetical protein
LTRAGTLASAQSQQAIHGVGRILFGQKMTENGRVIDAIELKWIRRVQRLAAEGFSMEKIAQRLNAEIMKPVAKGNGADRRYGGS